MEWPANEAIIGDKYLNKFKYKPRSNSTLRTVIGKDGSLSITRQDLFTDEEWSGWADDVRL
jgi:hypothetical protein